MGMSKQGKGGQLCRNSRRNVVNGICGNEQCQHQGFVVP